MRSFWLAKTEPETFSWQDMVREKKTTWDGVRNYAARNNLRAMQEGDLVLIYHSVSEKSVVGVAEVIKSAFDDPTDQSGQWSAVQMKAKVAVKKPVPLSEIKNDPDLQHMMLIKNSRLSVQLLTEFEFFRILEKGELSHADFK
jgi:predicted RNA-binding protein with PUA-like domain